MDGPNCNARNLPNIQHGFPSHLCMDYRAAPNPFSRDHYQISGEGMLGGGKQPSQTPSNERTITSTRTPGPSALLRVSFVRCMSM